MLKLEKKKDSFRVMFKGECVLEHSSHHPFVFVGTGNETIESYRGNYQIEDRLESRIPLIRSQLIENGCVFSSHGISVTVSFLIVNQRLTMKFSCNRPNFNRFWIRMKAEANEKVYGCGEQASYFNLRNRNYPLWTSEPGVGRDKSSLTTFYADKVDKAGGDYYTTYYPEPTFVSTRKYWLHVESTAYAEFDFRAHDYHELMFWEVPGKLTLSFSDSYLELLTDLTEFTGRPPMLPDFLHDGIILGVQGGIETVLNYKKLALEHGIKVNGLWVQDWVGHRFTTFGKRLYWNWVLNEKLYPNLKDEIVELGKENIAFLTYICPFLLENETLFNEAKSHGYLALNDKGDPYLEDFGEFYCGIVDLTHPQGFEWYKNVIKNNIIALGIKGWMADFGEYLPIDCILHNGVSAKIMHNAWPVLWARCNYEAVKETGNLGKIFYFMRAGGFGSQKYCTSMWAGDQSVNWETHDGIASVIPSALSTGIIGNPYTHSDIGGYTSLHGNIRTKELFDRWCEMNIFSSYMRTHEGNRPSQNFQFYNDVDTMKHMARCSNIKVDLKPYVLSLVEEAKLFGYPLQRPLFLHYSDDPVVYDLQYEFLFGQDLYVKPIVKGNSLSQNCYLPSDSWVHLWTGQEFTGGEVTVEAPIGYPPVFYRKQSSFRSLFEKISEKYGKGGNS